MKFSLDIAEYTRNLQSQNGLRHGDYHRYRHFCSRKLHRLRKGLKIPNGRHRFKKATIPDSKTSSRFLELLVIQSERSWAHGLTLKSEFALSDNDSRGKIRHRYLHKFRRAVFWSSELLSLAHRACDSQTILEATAYNAWLESLALTEFGQYERALEKIDLTEARYTELIKQSLDVILPTASKAYKHRISDLEPITRVCKYKLRIGMGGATSHEAETSAKDEFESVYDEMSENEGEVDFGSSGSEMEDDDLTKSPRRKPETKTGILGKIGGWWNKQ